MLKRFIAWLSRFGDCPKCGKRGDCDDCSHKDVGLGAP